MPAPEALEQRQEILQLSWLILGVLGVWRIIHLLEAEDGPWNVVVRMRRIAGSGWLGAMLDCFHCLSLWIAIPFALILGESWLERLLWPALSASAILLERGCGSNPPAKLEEKPDVVLRQDESGAEKSRAPTQSNPDTVVREDQAGRLVNRAEPEGLVGNEPNLKPIFQYIGATAMVVTCLDSGRRYRFPRSGARIEVDPRDVATLVAIPKLRALNV
jgi:hypothetical protein